MSEEMITQQEFNKMALRAKVAMEAERTAKLQELAALLYARGYRAEEMILFHHEGEMSAAKIKEQWVVTDSTCIYLRLRQPIPEGRIRLRRWWRRWIQPYENATLDRIETRFFPLYE